MRCPIQPEYRKYVQGYGFLSFAKKFVNKYGKKMAPVNMVKNRHNKKRRD